MNEIEQFIAKFIEIQQQLQKIRDIIRKVAPRTASK